MPLLHTILRRTFYTTAALSTLLLLATLILWPVSHYRLLSAYYVTGEDEYFFNADSGRAVVVYASDFPPAPGWYIRVYSPQSSHWGYLSWNTPDPDTAPVFASPTFLGVCGFHLPPDFGGGTYRGALVPFSYLALLFSILPLLAFRSIRRQRRARRVGLCPKCGYDLRAQHAGAGGAVCPECGTPVAGRGPSQGLSGLSSVVALPEAAGGGMLAGPWDSRSSTMAPSKVHLRGDAMRIISPLAFRVAAGSSLCFLAGCNSYFHLGLPSVHDQAIALPKVHERVGPVRQRDTVVLVSYVDHNTFHCMMRSDGACSQMIITNIACMGGVLPDLSTPVPMPAGLQQQLDQVYLDLPASQRVKDVADTFLVSWSADGLWTTRTYDRTKLPASARALLKLLQVPPTWFDPPL